MVENGSPVEITSSGVIEAPASELWALVSDFGDVARWHPDVTSSRLESGSGNEAGAVRSIRLRNGLSAFLMVVASSNMAFAQSAKLDKNATISQIEDYSVGPVERLLVRAADAMPEDKYVFAPTNGEFKGVRTFAQHVKHVAVSNYVMAAAILQEKAPVELGGNDANGPASIASKVDCVNFLKDSFAYLHKAFSSINENNVAGQVPNPEGAGTVPRLDIANRTLWHSLDHYGQMVEYLRMNGIIPPASRR